MKHVSVVIIAFNEEENIERCIASVQEIADQVLVIDSGSTDRTREIAESLGARVIYHAFEGHIQQKNFARQQVEQGWVLSLDADEAIDEKLLKEIKKWKHIDQYHTTGFYINRLNFYCGKPYKTFGWYPDRKIRLWKKNKGEWKGTNPHDSFVMNPKEPTNSFRGNILHNTYPTRASFLIQRENFANISAQNLKEENIFYLTFKMFFSPAFKFIKTYFVKLGIKEGFTGLFICYHLSREVFLKYFRAIKLKHK